MIFRQIVFYALFVGVISGSFLTVAQLWKVIPIIHIAESYETQGSESLITTAKNVESDSHSHDHSAWGPSDGVERSAFTLMSNILTAMGFALFVLVAMIYSSKIKTALKWQHGLLWGIAGYLTFFLAPSIGMPPEIPGSMSASLESRQLWWLFSVICTAVGLAGLAFGKTPWKWLFPALLVLPYLVSVPQAPENSFPGKSPEAILELEQLTNQFFSATAISNATLWITLGIASIWAVRRIVSPQILND